MRTDIACAVLARIDRGKTTLADGLLELTRTIPDPPLSPDAGDAHRPAAAAE